MVIGGIEIAPGVSKRIDLNVARLPSNTLIDIPIYVYRSRIEGPTLVLLAGMHGDEINGVEVVRRLRNDELIIPTRGTVITIPILNIYGFLNYSREVADGKDVNRSFPGNRKGSLASRVAHMFMTEIFPHMDYGVDYHTGGRGRTNYPQVRCEFSNPEHMEIARAFGAPLLLNAKTRNGSLRHAASKNQKNMIVYEGGEALRFDGEAIDEAINGTVRLMNHLKMTETPAIPQVSLELENSTWMRARSSGMFHSLVNAGDRVERKQMIGHISDPFGELKVKIKASHTGVIVGKAQMPIVSQGDALFHIGFSESDSE